MRCGHCGRNQATKTYEQIKNNKKVVEYYCMDCYERLFLSLANNAETALSVCPYCGTTLEEFRTSKLVGCAHCYPALQEGIMPVILKMQGERAHTGKTPPLDFFVCMGYNELTRHGRSIRLQGGFLCHESKNQFYHAV